MCPTGSDGRHERPPGPGLHQLVHRAQSSRPVRSSWSRWALGRCSCSTSCSRSSQLSCPASISCYGARFTLACREFNAKSWAPTLTKRKSRALRANSAADIPRRKRHPPEVADTAPPRCARGRPTGCSGLLHRKIRRQREHTLHELSRVVALRTARPVLGTHAFAGYQ
jgi:hypothetical protein